MSITLSSSTTNNSDWKTQFQFTDAETGDLIDFTGATIEVEVRDFDGCQRIEATTGNGLITIQSTGIFELDVPATTMANLCPGADSDDFAQAFRFQIAQDSDLISPTVPI